MKSLLFYNLYCKNGWKHITEILLKDSPYDSIIIHASLDSLAMTLFKKKILSYLSQIPKVKNVHISKNNMFGEYHGLEFLRKAVLNDNYSTVCYLHSKGVTKPNNKNIDDWINLMTYFLIERKDLVIKKFKEGYGLYGVNLGKYSGGIRYGPYQFSDFHYSGNFVAVNLNILRDKIKTTPVDKDYFGVEGYWGKLCDVSLAYNAHDSSKHIKNHYKEPYPEHLYRDDI